MKILINQSKYSEKFISITNALHSVPGLEIGFGRGDLNETAIVGFQPSIFIHDNPEYITRFRNGNWLHLCLHDNDGFTHDSAVNLRTIGPCYDSKITSMAKIDSRFQCEILLVGDPALFGQSLYRYMDLNHRFRIFYDKPLSFPQYCGSVPREYHPILYKNARLSLFSLLEDKSKFYEIIASKGTPVIYDDSNPDLFHQILSGEKSPKEGFVCTEKDMEEYNNHSVLARVLNQTGFTNLAGMVLKNAINI